MTLLSLTFVMKLIENSLLICLKIHHDHDVQLMNQVQAGMKAFLTLAAVEAVVAEGAAVEAMAVAVVVAAEAGEVVAIIAMESNPLDPVHESLMASMVPQWRCILLIISLHRNGLIYLPMSKSD